MRVFIILSIVSISTCLNVTFQPKELLEFRVGETRSVILRIEDDSTPDAFPTEPSVNCSALTVCKVTAVKRISEERKNGTVVTYNVTVQTVFVGITDMEVIINNESVASYVVRVMRAAFYVKLAVAFGVVLGTFVVVVTFMMGTQLEWGKIKGVLRVPIGPAIGFVCQFVLMPLTGYILAEVGLNQEDIVLKLALFAASTCPGGGKSSFWTIIYGGNLDLSVAMTFTQTLAALVMMPFWLATLGKNFTTNRVDVPFLAIIEGLLVLLIPSGLGMYFIQKKPHLIKKIEKYIKKATWFATIFFTVFGILANWYIFFLFTWRTVIIGCMLPWCGYIIAYLTAAMFRQNKQDRTTIAIETGVQNVGIATILMMWSLPEPEVDIALTILFTIMLATDKPLMLIWLLSELRQRIWGTTKTKEEKEEQTMTAITSEKAVPSVDYKSTTTEARKDVVVPTATTLPSTQET